MRIQNLVDASCLKIKMQDIVINVIALKIVLSDNVILRLRFFDVIPTLWLTDLLKSLRIFLIRMFGTTLCLRWRVIFIYHALAE